jgi:hypothetical protein
MSSRYLTIYSAKIAKMSLIGCLGLKTITSEITSVRHQCSVTLVLLSRISNKLMYMLVNLKSSILKVSLAEWLNLAGGMFGR